MVMLLVLDALEEYAGFGLSVEIVALKDELKRDSEMLENE